MNFDILFVNNGSSRPMLNSFDEGVEFGFQNLNHNREWIPLAFYSFHNPTRRNEEIKIGPDLMLNDRITLIRGHNASIYLVGGTIVHKAELKLCGSEIMQNNASLSFRWLQTVKSSSASNSDIAYLDDVKININNFPEEHNGTLSIIFFDCFNSESMIE